jgi:hypothetical protein
LPTGNKGIALVARIAATHGEMILHGARGMHAAHPGTGVHAVLIDARQMARTLSIDDALRLALDVGVARVVPDAGAGGRLLAGLCAYGIDAAGRGVARLFNLHRKNGAWLKEAAGERIPSVAWIAHTDGHMVAHATSCIDAAQAGTRVLTLLIDAGLVWGTVRVDEALGAAVGR